MSRAPTFLLLLFVFLAAPGWAVSQPAQDPVELDLDRAKSLYVDGRLEEAVTALRSVIVKINELKDLQVRRLNLAEAHLHLGLSYLALRDEPMALENFRRVVTLEPERRLDPEIHAPRVIATFERARADVSTASPGVVSPEPARAPATPAAPLLDSTPARPLNLIEPGTRIRVKLDGFVRPLDGTLLTIGERQFSLSAANQSIAYDRNGVRKVEVLTGRRNHWLAGLIVGTASGVLIGAAETPGCDSNECYTRAENMSYTGIGMGLVGALVGALYRTDEWAEVPINHLAVTVSPAPRFAVSFGWRR